MQALKSRGDQNQAMKRLAAADRIAAFAQQNGIEKIDHLVSAAQFRPRPSGLQTRLIRLEMADLRGQAGITI